MRVAIRSWKSKVRIAVLLPLFAVSATHAQTNITIDWFTINGGGGASTGGVYAVSGTMGQPDVGTMNGGGYAIEGGFWSFIGAIQTPGAPPLSISYTATNAVIIFWPSPSDGFVLQQKDDVLSTTSWATPTNSPVKVGENWLVTVSPTSGKKFYRLTKP
jgi:hypothetical protein